MKELLVSMKRPAPLNFGVRYSAYPTGADALQLDFLPVLKPMDEPASEPLSASV